MTTPLVDITGANPTIAPLPEQNQQDAQGIRTRKEIAREVVQRHRAGLDARRDRDLLSEKFLLHIDGTGDFQWADVFHGQRVEIPRFISEFRKTENVLRLLVDNAVAHHTTMPLRYLAESAPDRRSKDRALIDTLWMNHVAQQQDFNALSAEALYLSMPAGFCPIHGYWREDSYDQYQPVMNPEQVGFDTTTSGLLDCWVGNPWDTVFDPASRRGSMHWASYGRVLPADMVRAAFSHVPDADKIEGTNKLPSAAEFQRIARSWRFADLGIHGSGVVEPRRTGTTTDDELILVICREILPGVDKDWPDGRLTIVAVPGAGDLRRREGTSGEHGILLVDQALPARDFSFSVVYSHHRFGDVYGKPWVEDLDQLQVDLNIALSKRWETINKMTEAPILVPAGMIADDMADIGGYNIMELDPSIGSSFRPRVMEWPVEIIQALDKEVAEKRQALYTGGGYQASSRGEAPGSRMAYRAIVALQQADSGIHTPVNMRFQRSLTDFAQKCWKQMKMYGDVPWMVNIVGDDYSHLAEPYIDNTKLSEYPPRFKLVNSFGPSPELRAQEILELMQMRGADNEVFLSTEEARRLYPDPLLFADRSNPRHVQRRRAKTVATTITHLAERFRRESGFEEQDISHPWVQQAAMQIFAFIEQRYPRLRDDDLEAHLAALSEITQDETADAVARMAAMQRQNMYYEWQAMMAGQPAGGGTVAGMRPAGPEANQLDPRSIASEMQGAGGAGASTLQNEPEASKEPALG